VYDFKTGSIDALDGATRRFVSLADHPDARATATLPPMHLPTPTNAREDS